jgi:amino acid permease
LLVFVFLFVYFSFKQGLWTAAFGSKSSPLVSLIVFLQGSASQVIYLGMLGDIFTALFQMMGVPNAVNNRSSNILILAITFLLPMCLLRDLAALAFTSILGFSAVMYTVIFIAIRALDGTYSLGTSPSQSSVGKFIADNALSTMPSFEKSTWWNINLKSLLLVSNLGLAYIAHYNAPTYFRELKQATAARFSKTVGISYGILALIYVVTMCAGYATFGDACRNNILLNYHPKDVLSTLGRWATGFSILFGFPLVNNGAREGLKNFCYSALGWKAIVDPKNHHLITVLYLSFLTLIAVSVRDVGLVVGLSGAIFGSFLVYICPALIYTTIVKKVNGRESTEYSKAKLNIALIPFGLFCGAMGVSLTIREALMKKR